MLLPALNKYFSHSAELINEQLWSAAMLFSYLFVYQGTPASLSALVAVWDPGEGWVKWLAGWTQTRQGNCVIAGTDFNTSL